MWRRWRSSESGVALIAVLLAMALLTVIGAALTAVGVVEYRSSLNHRSATRALLLADAGATHALALMRGPLSGYSYDAVLLGADAVPSSADDGQFLGFVGLLEADAIADTGFMLAEGRYFVTVVNDPEDPSGDPLVDSNDRVLAICRGETPDGGRAEVRAIFASPHYPSIVSNGDLTMPGNPDVVGPCGGVHANHVLRINGNPTINGSATASDTVILIGTIVDEAGVPVIPGYAPPIEVPEYDPLQFCSEADYILRNGWVVTVGPPSDSAYAGGGPKVLGWSWSAADNKWSLAGNKAVPGTVCAYGNIEVTGNTGSNGNPLQITLLATGSVKIAGNPKIAADHSDGILIVAAGDVRISGNSSGTTPAYSGMIYAGSQCMVNGTPDVGGYILCYDAPDPLGAADLTSENKINGTPTITYDCDGAKQRTHVSTWWEARTG